jgi:hypothetical protein
VQKNAQAFLTALLKAGASLDDLMQAFVVPFMLTDIPAIQKCGRHSGIPKCCTKYLITKVLPAVVKGGKFPKDDVPYIRCPTCRRANRRISLKRCNCFHFLG